jgi:hypothetical protein
MAKFAKKIFLYITFLCLAFSGYASEDNFLASVDVENDGIIERYQYYYDKLGNRTVQLISDNSIGEFTNTTYTEWYYIEDLCFSETIKKWEQDAYMYINHQRTSFEYFRNQISKKTVQKWENEQWVNQYNELFTYDIFLTSHTSQYWINNEWENQVKSMYFYDGNNISAIVFFIWQNNSWTNSRKITKSYNENNLLITETTYNWNAAATSWIEEERATLFYNKQNFVELEVKEIWNDDRWINNERFCFEYNSSDLITSQTRQFWNQYWQDNLKINHIYDNFLNPVSKEFYIWKMNMWLPAYYENLASNYDNKQISSESFVSFWESANNNDEYFSKHLTLQHNKNTEFYFGEKYEAAYKPLQEIINENLVSGDQAIIFPNPSPDGVFYVSIQDFTLDNWTAASIDGKIIKQFQNDTATERRTFIVNIQGFPTGMYVLKIQTNEGKIIKAKLINK